jgi:tetratricopeptide (TPR) repeat protein
VSPARLLILALFCGCAIAGAADRTLPAGAPPRTEDTNQQDNLQGYLQVQEQLHATQLAIERNRQEANAAALESAKAFASRLQGIEAALSSQRTQELQAMQSSNKAMLLVAGMFAALGLLAMLFMAFFQWRTISRLAEIAAALPAARALAAGHGFGALSAGDAQLFASGPAEQSNQQLLGALERLEKRIHELEEIPHAALPALPTIGSNGGSGSVSGNGASTDPSTAGDGQPPTADRTDVLLAKGQSLLNLDKAEEALACFDQVLAVEATHAEALVRKGAALERLNKLDEAIACYDKAIAANSSLTVAYLYKGGLFNRLERFSEALECYEQALHTQEHRRG